MNTFAAPDGIELAYRVLGGGEPLVCVPGGMLAGAYLGDLGGLSAYRQLVILDLRASGESGGEPARCDQLVPDLEALREYLGLEKLSLLGHSAGASLVTRYAESHPERIERLVLATPSPRSIGIDMTAERRRRVLDSRRDEPWYPEVSAAFEAIQTGEGQDWGALNPAFYGRWDGEAQAQQALEDKLANLEALQAFVSDGAFDPPVTRAALAKVDAPVLVISGALDWGLDTDAGAEYAALFPNADHVVLKGAAHHPWLDERDAFVTSVSRFLTD